LIFGLAWGLALLKSLRDGALLTLALLLPGALSSAGRMQPAICSSALFSSTSSHGLSLLSDVVMDVCEIEMVGMVGMEMVEVRVVMIGAGMQRFA
jgi:hypothetical protein